MLKRIGLLSLPICAVLLAGSAAAQTGLVAYWKLDEHIGATSFADSSGSGDAGTCSGTSCPVLGVPGVFGTAANFVKGGNYISIGNPANLNLGKGSFTYSLWVYVPASIGPYDMPLWKGGGSAGSPGFDMELGTGNWSANLADGSKSVQVVFGTETDNKWVLLTAVVDRSAGLFKAYRNGLPVASVGLGSLGSVSSSNPLYIGGVSSYRFNGAIDDVRIYNTALSSTDVANLYSGSAPAVSISISPSSVSLQAGGAQQFTATASGTTNTAVSWSATGGTISSSGLYTAPSTGGTYTVKATSAADSTKSASATVTVPAASGVQVSVQSPTTGATLSSPVLFAAAARSAYPITGFVVYANNQNVYQTNNSTLNGSASLAAGTYTVLIRAWDSTGAYGTSPAISITVGSSFGVSVSPSSVSLFGGGTQQFTANVTGTTNTSVNWSATGGTVSYMGYYTAPSLTGTYKVTATSAADSTKSASAVVTVKAPVSVAISPTSASLSAGASQQFTANVSGTSNTAVTWSASGGTISSTGLYIAPSTTGTYTVTATSVADTTKSASAALTVSSIAGTNRYISTGGVDSGSCTNAASPCHSFTYVDSIAASGDVVHVAPGSYNLTSSTCIVTNKSGVTWQSDVHGAATINGGGNCLYMWHSSSGSGHIKIFGFQFTGIQVNSSLSSVGMLLEGGQGNYEVAYNTFHDSGTSCTSSNCFASALDITPYSGGYTGRTCSIHDNTFYNLAVGLNGTYNGYGIYATCSNANGDADPRIYNNLIYNEGSIGIHMWHSANHIHVYNNTVDHARMGILVGTGDSGGTTGAIFDVSNNIVSNSYYGIYAEDGGGYTLSSSSTFDNNLTYNNSIDWGYNSANGKILTSFQAAKNITGDPLYVSPSSGNYFIGAGSPAATTGLHNSYTPALDLAGVTRPNPPSIGAYEP